MTTPRPRPVPNNIPYGTPKSDLLRQIAESDFLLDINPRNVRFAKGQVLATAGITGADYFDRVLAETEPTDVFGPPDIKAMVEDGKARHSEEGA